MTDQPLDEWRQVLLDHDGSLTEGQRRILTEGPRGLSQAWILGGLKKRYKDRFSKFKPKD